MSLHFVTYGDEKFEINRKRLCEDIDKLKIFEIHSYSKEDLPVDYVQEFKDLLINSNRGAGYWTWKPRLFIDVMSKEKDDDIILWSDAGCSVNFDGVKRLHEWIDMCDFYGTLGFQMEHIERVWTKRSLSKFMNCDNEEIMNTGQIMATIFLLKNDAKTFKMVNEWYEIARHRWTIDDSPSIIENYSDFKEHRHDQSIWSLLRKIDKTFNIKDETWSDDWHDEFIKQIPIWGTRKRS